MRVGDFSEGCMDGSAWPEASPSESEITKARLVRTIEGEIVPRLVLMRRAACAPGVERMCQSRFPDGSDVRELVRLLMAHDVSVASAYVETVRQRGATLEMVCLELLAPAARQFGRLWEEDECDFMQVTLGLCRLHQLLRELSSEFGSSDLDRRKNRRILLAPCPGDQHTFGLSLVAQFLRRADWEVWHEFPATAAEIIEIAGQNWFGVIGFSVGTEARLDQLKATIRAVRRESRNREVGILVGGPILVEKPELARIVGADATAADGQQAVLRAEHICSALRDAN
jgi:methanogenic corrinoid protein MtbC1